MMLKHLIEFLETQDPNKVVPLGFWKPHSYRGYYDQLAFAPVRNVTVESMLVCAKRAMFKTFQGWKGGEYTMNEWTEVWLAEPGETGEGIGEILLRYMMGEYND